MRLSALCLAALLPVTALAQDRANTILVLDGSGSMWGQIEGTAKITIAQDVVRDLLGTIPGDQQLGLTVYGHRTRGDCSDIETIVAPGAGTRGAIAEAVGAITPLGKTPMTDAVIAAANALRFTEEKATVVLVSDGVETCNPDPCAAARALEEAGIDFTAHVVGFNVSEDPEALAQMQCIAAETGGQFLTAENATELSSALVTVAAEPAPPAPVTVTFRGRAGPDGPIITDPLVWSISGDLGQVANAQSAPSLAYELPPGDYRVSALWPQYEESVDLTARVSQSGIVDVVFPAPPPPPVEVTFQAIEGRNGPRITDPLQWQFFQSGAQLGDTLTGPTITGAMPQGAYRVVVTRPEDGASAEETFGVGSVNATVTLILPEFRPPATLDAPADAVAGSTFDVIWTGPNQDLDYVATVRPGARPGESETYTYTREGPLLKVKAPATPGEYQLQYVLRDGSKVLAAQSLTVTPVVASFEAPVEGIAGETMTITWEGPDYELDYFAVVEPGAARGASINYTYTRDGTPLGLKLPAEPGTYEIQYVMRQDSTVLARAPITVVAVGAEIDAPDTAIAGETVTVEWTGPNYELDFIAVSKAGDEDGRYENYTYTREGTPLGLVMPTEPGQYEIRYTLRQDSRVIARRPITVTGVTAVLSAPDTATAGETVTVEWTGPDYELDYISVAKAGEADGRYENYTYTREGTPLGVVMPTEPGAYELRYTLRQDSQVIARMPITVTATTATLEVPATAPAGSAVPIRWTGPDYNLDFISIARPDERDGQYEAYTYTREGSNLTVEAPMTPGVYEIRYTLRQDSRVIARKPIEITAVTATLDASATAPAGGPLPVIWDGPGYQRDQIAVVAKGARSGASENFRYTRDGAPAEVIMPAIPGTYELQYIAFGKPITVLARKDIEVTPVTASLAPMEGAKAGDFVQLAWEGPGYGMDAIVIAEPGGRKVFRQVRPRGVSPVEIQMPSAPGTYELRYVMAEDNTVLATAPLVISE